MSNATFNFMLVRKISGIPAGRYARESTALSALRKKQSGSDPIELREYSEAYYNSMK